jgi:hypothetical protein
MRRHAIIAVLILLAAATAHGTAYADILHLKTGMLEGKLVERSNGKVRFRTTSGIVTTIDEKDVLALVERETPREVYQSIAKDIESAEGHYALAMWCRDHDLANEAKNELVAALEANPQHRRARLALGYVKTDAGWVTAEEAMRAKGKEKVDGRWMTEAEAREYRVEKRQEKLLHAINTFVYKTRVTSGSRADRWENKLASINDPVIAWKMLKLLRHDVPRVRRAACTSLAAMKHRDAVPHLVRRHLLDPSEPVRDAAIRALLRLDRRRAAEEFYDVIADLKLRKIDSRGEQRSLKRLYRRIALALDQLDDIRSVPFLIEILYPKIEITRDFPNIAEARQRLGVYRGGGGPTAVDVVEGGVVLGTGTAQSLPIREKYYFNQAAEDALKRLTGQDLGVLPKDWRRWWNKHGAELTRERKAAKRADDEQIDRLIEEQENDRSR